ncbi:hypothetical protein [Paracoccus sp. (in: a-proteobacteria)]|nr:hypothetical protein [Paracoccus sp. (in: a-proteobacteria)]
MTDATPISDAEFLKRLSVRCAKRGEYKNRKRLEKIAQKLRAIENEGEE